MVYFLTIHSLNDELEKLLFVFNCRSGKFSYFMEKLPSITFNNYKTMFPQKKGSSATRDGKIPLSKCSSPIALNLCSSVTSNDF